MFRSLLAALAFSLVAVPAAEAANDAASALQLPSGKVDSQSAARNGRSSGRSAGKARSSRSGGSQRSSGKSKDSGSSRSRGDDRSSNDRGDSAPAKSDSPARAEGPARSEGASDRGGSESAARDARPEVRDTTNARTAEPAVRHIDNMRPGTASGAARPDMRSVSGSEARRAPVNYRGSTHVAATSAARHAQATRRAHTAAVAHAHQRAAYVHARTRARAHVSATRWHSAWVRHHYARAVWHHPRTWFTPWHPGYRHHWYHGVFVYGPAPWSPPPPAGAPEPEPKRTVDHVGDLSLGIRGGSYISGYSNGASFGDFGLGVAARYRVAEPVGLELQWNYHDDTWSQGSERIEQPLSASVDLFAFPWSRVNPYAVAGLTLTNRNVYDAIGGAQVDSDQAYWGPHGGLGVEFNISQKTSINLDARWIGYVNKDPADLAHPGAVQLNSGLNFYF